MVKAKSKPLGKPPEEAFRVSGYALAFLIFNRVMDLLRLCVWFGGPALIGYVFVVLPLQATAGKTTTVSFLYQMVFAYKLDLAATSAAAAIAIALWSRERKTRKDTVERLHAQIKELELKLDPDRSTSGLTPRGDTPKGLL